MPVFTRSSLLPATVEELFLFHENPHNLRHISPPGMRILEIRASQVAQPGAEFTLAVRQGPLTLRWTGRWETVESPHLLTDTGVLCGTTAISSNRIPKVPSSPTGWNSVCPGFSADRSGISSAS